MGLILLPIAAAIFLAWAAVTWMLVKLAMAAVRDLPGGAVLKLLVPIPVVALCWFIPNIGQWQQQRAVAAMATDCGWKVHRPAPPVAGGILLARVPGPGRGLAQHHNDSQLRSTYGLVAPLPADGRVPSPELRYGLRTAESAPANGFFRLTTDVVDFRTGDVLATFRTYEPADQRLSMGVFEMAVRLLLMDVRACPGLPRSAFMDGLPRALPPLKTA